jgi:hypothetical protein
MKTRHAIAASLGLALAIPRTQAADTPVDAESVKAKVHHLLTTEGQVSDNDMAGLEKGIDTHSGDHGFGEAISTAVHDALAKGCKGTCLAAVIHKINGAMDKGTPAAQAARDAGEAHADARADSLREQAQDRVRDRTQNQGAAGSHAMGGGRR